jgi:hypothetical protein
MMTDTAILLVSGTGLTPAAECLETVVELAAISGSALVIAHMRDFSMAGMAQSWGFTGAAFARIVHEEEAECFFRYSEAAVRLGVDLFWRVHGGPWLSGTVNIAKTFTVTQAIVTPSAGRPINSSVSRRARGLARRTGVSVHILDHGGRDVEAFLRPVAGD